MILSFIKICKVTRKGCFQHFPLDLANVNEWKIMYDPSIVLPAVIRSLLFVAYYNYLSSLFILNLDMVWCKGVYLFVILALKHRGYFRLS